MGTDADYVIQNWTIPGLTKRELFAAMAMQAYISTSRFEAKDAAPLAAKAADALLAALEAAKP